MLLFLKWIEITICFTFVFLGVALGSKYKKEKYRHKPKRSGVHFFVSLVTRALYWGAWMAPWMVDWGFTLRGLFVFAVGCGVRDFKALTAPSSPTCSLSCYTLLCSLYTQIQNVLNTLHYSTTYRKRWYYSVQPPPPLPKFFYQYYYKLVYTVYSVYTEHFSVILFSSTSTT